MIAIRIEEQGGGLGRLESWVWDRTFVIRIGLWVTIQVTAKRGALRNSNS